VTVVHPLKVYDFLADGFVAEKVDTVFGVMGDSNMYWTTSMVSRAGVSVVHARHEAAAVLMADGYARISGKVGVCSVTCGPGVTHATSSLTAAVRRRSPIVMFSGGSPTGEHRHPQEFPLEQLVALVGADLVGVEDDADLIDAVPRAFFLARSRSKPVVLLVSPELQMREQPPVKAKITSDDLIVESEPIVPDPLAIQELAKRLNGARYPVLLAGAGAVACGDDLVRLADSLDAHLATTLAAKGLFDGEERSLGVSGGYSSSSTRALLMQADVVVAFGASLHYHTTDRGQLFASAEVTQIDVDPPASEDGHQVDAIIRADAGLATKALLRLVGSRRSKRPPVERPVVAPPPLPELDAMPGVIDPAVAIRRIDELIPKDWHVVVGAGHFSAFVLQGLRDRHPSFLHTTYNFGAIGQGLATGIGASEFSEDPVVVIEGDGGLMQSIQELETVARYQWPLLLFVMNDGAYGSEYHKLMVEGLNPMSSVFGYPDFARMAQGFGLDGSTIRTPEDVEQAVRGFRQTRQPRVADVQIDYRVPSEYFRRLYYG